MQQKSVPFSIFSNIPLFLVYLSKFLYLQYIQKNSPIFSVFSKIWVFLVYYSNIPLCLVYLAKLLYFFIFSKIPVFLFFSKISLYLVYLQQFRYFQFIYQISSIFSIFRNIPQFLVYFSYIPLFLVYLAKLRYFQYIQQNFKKLQNLITTAAVFSTSPIGKISNYDISGSKVASEPKIRNLDSLFSYQTFALKHL